MNNEFKANFEKQIKYTASRAIELEEAISDWPDTWDLDEAYMRTLRLEKAIGKLAIMTNLSETAKEKGLY